MVGLLDILSGNSPAFAAGDPAFSNMPNPGLWGALNQASPLQGLDEEQRRKMAEAAALGGMGIDPGNTGTPQVSPFTVAPTPAPAPAAAPSGFGAGASPFGFAGPGSMIGINTAQMQGPSPIGPPAPIGSPAPAPQVAAAPATDLSSVNRPPVAAGPDSVVPVGNYKMPMFGEAPDAAEQPTRQPAAPVVTGSPSPAAPFSLAGSGQPSRLSAGLDSFNNTTGGGLFGKLTAGVSGLVTGQRTDPAGVALNLQRQSDNATAQALLSKGAPAADVAASIKNPALQKALIEQYYGKDKWNVVKVGEDNGVHIYKQQNQVDGTLRDIPGVSSSPASGGFVTGPDGKAIPIPPGVDRKEFVKRVTEASADGATGKATEAQGKASSFAARMTQAEGVLGGLQNQGLNIGSKIAESLPGGNYLQSPEYQRYKQASSAFITAMLRQESGAAINKDEFSRYEKELFPQPGDDPSVVAQKAQQRAAAIQQMTRSAGPGYKPPSPGGTVNVGGSAINWSVK